MRHTLIMLLAALLLATLIPATGFGQTASKAETDTVLEIAQCMARNAPVDWQQLYMVVELPEAGAPAGRVRYLAARPSAAVPEPYVPCDPKIPAQLLMDSRAEQSAERRGWTGARLVIHRSGRFDLNYDYPKPSN